MGNIKYLHAYEEQVERATRYYERFKRANDGMPRGERAEDEWFDDVYAFFHFCYHIKDYLKNDPAYTKHTAAEIEAYVSSTDALAICADICNASKHLTLDKPPRSGDAPQFISTGFGVWVEGKIGDPQRRTMAWITMSIEHKGTKIRAFEVATEAMKAWKAFI